MHLGITFIYIFH